MIYPFLSNKCQLAREYYYISCDLMNYRIATRMQNLDNDIYRAIEDQLTDMWNNATEEELKDIESLPRRWWFQYSDEKGVTPFSELQVYPYAEYFVDQKPHLLGDDVSVMKGKPYFGDKCWHPHDAVMHCYIEGYHDFGLGSEMVAISNRHYEELQRDYEFVRYSRFYPVFKRKD